MQRMCVRTCNLDWLRSSWSGDETSVVSCPDWWRRYSGCHDGEAFDSVMDVANAQYNYRRSLRYGTLTYSWLDAISRFWIPISRFLLLVILISPDFYLAKVDRSGTWSCNLWPFNPVRPPLGKMLYQEFYHILVKVHLANVQLARW